VLPVSALLKEPEHEAHEGHEGPISFVPFA
jgi:hypothetical protein